MKKWILHSANIVLFLLICIGVFLLDKGYTQEISKKKLSSERLEIIKQKIKASQDIIRLDPESKGSFSCLIMIYIFLIAMAMSLPALTTGVTAMRR